MAKINPANVAPDAYPRIRGVVLTRSTDQGLIAQAWPKKRGPSKTKDQIWLTQQFGLAGRMAANSEPMQWETAKFLTRGTVWMPRDLLVMAAYGKAYEVTGPDGFAYFQADHTRPPDVPDEEWRISAQSVIATTDVGWAGYTLRQRILAADIAEPDGFASRVTIKAGNATGGLNVIAAYIAPGVLSGNPYAFTSAPHQVLFGGLAAFTLPPGGEIVSDQIPYAPAGGENLVLSMACGATSAFMSGGTPATWQSYYKAGNDAATVAATGYTSWAHATGLSLLETKHYT